jgi:hypothetical protein
VIGTAPWSDDGDSSLSRAGQLFVVCWLAGWQSRTPLPLGQRLRYGEHSRLVANNDDERKNVAVYVINGEQNG